MAFCFHFSSRSCTRVSERSTCTLSAILHYCFQCFVFSSSRLVGDRQVEGKEKENVGNGEKGHQKEGAPGSKGKEKCFEGIRSEMGVLRRYQKLQSRRCWRLRKEGLKSKGPILRDPKPILARRWSIW